MHSALDKHKQESRDTLVATAEAEARLLIANERYVGTHDIHYGLIFSFENPTFKDRRAFSTAD